MHIPALIGSILLFKNNGISQSNIEFISQYLKKDKEIFISRSISQIFYDMGDYSEYFQMIDHRIVISHYYASNNNLLKKRFFDSLSDDDKNIIYYILNRI